MRRTSVLSPIALCLLAVWCATQPAGEAADTVYTNRKIYTVNEAQP